jgi:hypothetical protein
LTDLLPFLVVFGTETVMCHEYGMRWWKSETAVKTEKNKTEDAKPDFMSMFTPRQEEKPQSAPAGKVEEKELVPVK